MPEFRVFRTVYDFPDLPLKVRNSNPLPRFFALTVVIQRSLFVSVDANQMCIERGVMDFGERDAVRNHRLAKLLISVRDDMSRVEQQRLGQARQRAAAVVGGNNGFAEGRLVQPLFYGTQGIAPFERGLGIWFSNASRSHRLSAASGSWPIKA